MSFAPGVAAVAVDGMDQPVIVRMPLREAHEAAAEVVGHTPRAAARSRLCTPGCTDSRCTSRTINENAHRSRDALVTMWVETVVVSFLVGEPTTASARTWPRSSAASRDGRCTLVHEDELCVGTRGPLLATWFDVGDFAAHVLRALKPAGDTSDDGDWRRWAAGFFRWVEIRDALNRAEEAGRGHEPPHPDTELWAAMGMPLRGPTLAHQFAELKAHPSYGEGRQQFVVGDPARTGLLAAVDELSGTTTEEGIWRALDRACRGHRANLIEKRMGGLLRATGAAR